MPSPYDGWATNLIAPVLDLAQCAPAALPGHHYTFSGRYKGNGPIKVVAWWRNADNQWARLDWGAPGTKSFPLAAAWTKASFTFQAPAGATGVSAGFSIDSASRGHSYTIDDTSLVDESLTSFALSVTAAGAGSGSIASSPAGIACGATCQASFSYGTSVTLTATPVAGSSFTGWSGACTGSAACVVSMTAAQSVTATFAHLPVALAVATAGSGSGAVSSSPAGIACGTTCQASFAYGASVTLTATAATGSSFTGWSGACAGTAPTCTLAMMAARSATATFTADPPPPVPPVTPGPAAEAPVPPAAAPSPIVPAPVAQAPVVLPRTVAAA